jgi:hypothetical protein
MLAKSHLKLVPPKGENRAVAPVRQAVKRESGRRLGQQAMEPRAAARMNIAKLPELLTRPWGCIMKRRQPSEHYAA